MRIKLINAKQQGEYGEMRLQVEGTEQGLFLSKPYGDSMPYDFIADNLRLFLRIQVKTVNVRHQAGYVFRTGSSRVRKLRGGERDFEGARREYRRSMRPGQKLRAYRASEIDFIAGLVIPENAWYIIPVAALKGRTEVCVFPHNPHSRGMFERYKEAWHLLQ